MPRLTLIATSVIAMLGAATVAEAKTCKEPITVSSRSTVAGGEEARTKRATDTAKKKWSKEAQAKYGFQYKFWLRADASGVECRQTPKSTVCKVTATPCSLI